MSDEHKPSKKDIDRASDIIEELGEDGRENVLSKLFSFFGDGFKREPKSDMGILQTLSLWLVRREKQNGGRKTKKKDLESEMLKAAGDMERGGRNFNS